MSIATIGLWLVGCSGGDPTTTPDKGSTPTDTTSDPHTTPTTGTSTTDSTTTPTTDSTTDLETSTTPCTGLWLWDQDQDGTIESSGTTTWDPADPSRLLRIDYDYDQDGTVDTSFVYTYDGVGREIREEHIQLGVTDTVYEWDYGPNGELLEERLDADGDRPADGRFEERWDYTWDANGAMVSLSHDGSDQNLDYDTIDFWVTDPATGQTVTDSSDWGADGTFDVVYSYAWDDAGRISSITGDTDADGVADFDLKTWQYDDPVLKIGTMTQDADADGTVDYREDFEYDPVLDLQTYWGISNTGRTTWDIEQFVTWDPTSLQPATVENHVNYAEPPYVTWDAYTRDAFGRVVEHTWQQDEPTKGLYAVESYVETWKMSACP